MAHVLVTGATGFIGPHLVTALIERGDQVRCLVRQASRADRVERLHSLGAKTVCGHLGDRHSLAAAVAGVDVVYHLAGCTKPLRNAELRNVNEEGTANLVQSCVAAPPAPRLILVSSLAAAGPSPLDRPRNENDPPVPVSQYGLSKRAGELAAARHAGDVPISIVRPPIVLGEGDRDGFVMFRCIARWSLHTVPGLRPMQISLVHAADLAAGLIAVAERGERLSAGGDATGQGVYFVAADERPTFAQLGRMIANALDRPRVLVVRVPLAAMWLTAATTQSLARLTGRPTIINLDKYREAAAGHWTCSAEKIRSTLGIAPQRPLADRLLQTAQWYRQQGWL